MKIIFWIVFLFLALAVILFAIANRGPVTVSLDPFPVTFEKPLYLVALGAAFIGVLGTGLGVARAGWRARRRARRAEKRAAQAESELARLRGEAAAPDRPPPDQPPPDQPPPDQQRAVEDRRPPPARAIDLT